MRLRGYSVAILALAVLLVGASPAQAANSYPPRHGHHCKRGYKRVKRHHRTVCVRRRRKMGTTAPRVIKLHAHLDPSYTRDPLDPFKVTYAYSASATQEVAAASASTEEPAALPAGVLALYSDGTLECAVNVGGSVTGNECPVSYQALGSHRVTTIYSSGEQSATTTEVENIEPLPTTTMLSASFMTLPPSEVSSDKWRVGTLSINGMTQPTGSPNLSCSGAANCIEPAVPLNEGAAEVPVYARIGPWNEDNTPVYEVAIGGQWKPLSNFGEEGATYLRAVSSPATGYLPSEATAAIHFTPWLPGVFRANALSVAAGPQFAPLGSVGTYVKKGVNTPLRLKVSFGAEEDGCLYQVRVNGNAVLGDLGNEGRGLAFGVEVERVFEGMGSGSENVEVWVRSETPHTCELYEALVIASE